MAQVRLKNQGSADGEGSWYTDNQGGQERQQETKEQETDPQEETNQDKEQNADADEQNADEEDELESFRSLLSHLRLERLPELAISLKTASMPRDDARSSLTCTIDPEPLSGSYNILYRVTFSDSTEWVFRVPSIGYLPVWSEASARKLQSQAHTMNLIRRNTNIPVPEVFAFDPQLDNIINAPYIAMEFMNGTSMANKWFGIADGDEQLTDNQLEERKVKWLKAVAEYAFELGKFTFDKCGMLEFNDGGWPTNIGPLSVTDHRAEHHLQQCSDEPVPPQFREIGPFLDTKSYLLRLLDLCFSGCSMETTLRHFINWIPKSIANAQLGPNGHQFVLRHPDLDLQNIMISNDDDCRILSIIDWDSVATYPLCLGNERYPQWITRDWDPLRYQNTACYKYENTREELQRYREIYATYMQQLVGPGREAFTRFSHIYEALEVAAGDMYSFESIVYLLCGESLKASRKERLHEGEEGEGKGKGKDEDEEMGGGDYGEKEKEKDILMYDVVGAFEKDLPIPVEVLNRMREGFSRLCGEGY